MPSQTPSLENLLDAMPDALVVVERAGLIRFVNHQTELLFGYDRGELVGRPIETLVPESFRQVHAAHREASAAAPQTRDLGQDLELTGRKRDGTVFPMAIAWSSISTEHDLLVIAAARDLTHRKKAEAERRRADRMAAIVEHSDDGIISATLDGIVTSWNPAAERIYGYSSEEILGKPVGLTIARDRAGESSAILGRIGAGHPVEHLETIRVRKDGTMLPVSLTVSPILDAHGLIIGASTIVRDVSTQVQAFEAARSMIESSLDSLVSISPEGKITDVNEATIKVTGVPREQLIGTAFSDYFTEPEKANEIYQRVFAEGMAVDYPLTMRHQDGTLTDVLYNASVQRDAAGNVLGVFAAARDVTKQRQAHYARSLIEAGLDPLATISPEGKITDVNEATVKVTGVPREQLIGTDFSDYFTEPEKAREGYLRAFAEGSVTDYPLTMRHGNGALADVLYNASVYRDAAGNVLGVFAAARDVTERNQAQAAMAQQAKELDRLAELERFQRLTVGRELKMIELKKEIEALRRLLPTDGGEFGDQL